MQMLQDDDSGALHNQKNPGVHQDATGLQAASSGRDSHLQIGKGRR